MRGSFQVMKEPGQNREGTCYDNLKIEELIRFLTTFLITIVLGLFSLFL